MGAVFIMAGGSNAGNGGYQDLPVLLEVAFREEIFSNL